MQLVLTATTLVSYCAAFSTVDVFVFLTAMLAVAMIVNNWRNTSRQHACSDGHTSYTSYNNSLGKVALSTIEVLQLPGRVKQITCVSVNKQGIARYCFCCRIY